MRWALTAPYRVNRLVNALDRHYPITDERVLQTSTVYREITLYHPEVGDTVLKRKDLFTNEERCCLIGMGPLSPLWPPSVIKWPYEKAPLKSREAYGNEYNDR